MAPYSRHALGSGAEQKNNINFYLIIYYRQTSQRFIMFTNYLRLAILAITAASALSQSTPGSQKGLRGLSSNGAGGNAGSQRGLILQTDINDTSPSNPLPAGTYHSASGISLTGHLYLDATDASSGWTFDIKGGLSTPASTKMVFVKADESLFVPEEAGYQALYDAVSWTVVGTIDLGAESVAVGTIKSTHAAINMGAGATTGDLEATRGAINMGARATSGALVAGAAINLGARATANGAMDAGGAITLGAGATATGQLKAVGAINLGAVATVNGQIHAGAAITVGAGATSCFLCAGAAITMGAGSDTDNTQCASSCLFQSRPTCASSVGTDTCNYYSS
jgi:hypothetical protein